MQHPQRSTITHFFARLAQPAVEVIRWDGASDELINNLLWFFANTGKAPLVTDNVYSFLLNRIFESYTSEAAFLLDRATAQAGGPCGRSTGDRRTFFRAQSDRRQPPDF